LRYRVERFIVDPEQLTDRGDVRMGFGLKRRSRELALRAFNVIIIPEIERYHWPEKDYAGRLLEILEVDCVFDVGANRGQYGKWLRNLGFRGTIISFEPNPTAFSELNRHAADNWICLPYALGSETGELPFNVMADDVFSSFQNPSGVEEYAAENTIVQTVTARVKRLDQVLFEVAPNFTKPFLKLDTQGFDMEVVKGAGEAISGFRGIVSEVAIKRLYANSPTLEESSATICKRGFAPGAMFSVNPYKTLSVIEMNAYFVRKDLVSLDPL
jgi:FkbM family methyltransferase